MQTPLSDAERDAYTSEGFFVRERALDPATVAGLREAVEAIDARIRAAAASADPVEYIDDNRFQEVLGATVKWEWEAGSPHIRSMEPVHHFDIYATAAAAAPPPRGPSR